MQINRIGVALVSFFLLAGLAMVLAPIPGTAGGVFKLTGAIWTVVAVALVLYARREKRKAAHQDWVFRNGLRGRATVLEASGFGTLNELPIMRLDLELDVPGQRSRRVRRKETMSVFAARRMQPGLVLPTYVNPSDPSDFVLVW